MVLLCGLCNARSVTLWWQDDYDLQRRLCGHHSDKRAHAMVASGWQQIEDERDEWAAEATVVAQ